jgi:nucleotide-binding universal stress UspA family protein
MPAPQPGPVPRIVVGIDGSPSSQEALRWAVRQAELTGGTVDAVISWEYPAAIGGYGWAPASVIDEDFDFGQIAKKTLADTVSSVVGSSTEVTIRQLVVEDHPVQALMEAAKGADLLVVGSRGLGSFTGALLGSVSQHLVQHAPCPVVIIRGDAEH